MLHAPLVYQHKTDSAMNVRDQNTDFLAAPETNCFVPKKTALF
jgi:hypothetical protein